VVGLAGDASARRHAGEFLLAWKRKQQINAEIWRAKPQPTEVGGKRALNGDGLLPIAPAFWSACELSRLWFAAQPRSTQRHQFPVCVLELTGGKGGDLCLSSRAWRRMPEEIRGSSLPQYDGFGRNPPNGTKRTVAIKPSKFSCAKRIPLRPSRLSLRLCRHPPLFAALPRRVSALKIPLVASAGRQDSGRRRRPRGNPRAWPGASGSQPAGRGCDPRCGRGR